MAGPPKDNFLDDDDDHGFESEEEKDLDAAFDAASNKAKFVELAKATVPGVSVRQMFLAWDATSDVQGASKDETFNMRVNAAVDRLLDSGAVVIEDKHSGSSQQATAPLVSPLKGAFKSVNHHSQKKAVAFVDLAGDSSDVDVQPLTDVHHKSHAWSAASAGTASASSSRTGQALPGPSAGLRKRSPAEPKPEARLRKSSPVLTPQQIALQTVVAIFPDIEPDHVVKMLKEFKHNNKAESVIEELLTATTYPKKDVKGKKRAREEIEDQQPRKDYLDKGRPAPDPLVEETALSLLSSDFPLVQQPKIVEIFKANNRLFAPAYIALNAAVNQTDIQRGWKLMMRRRKDKGKDTATQFIATVEEERNWVIKHVRELKAAAQRESDLAKKLEQEIKDGAFFECGCCFGDSALSTLVMCASGCQFCSDCVKMHAETQIGMRKYILPCMDVSGCKATFSDADIKGILSAASLAALHKIKQERELDEAELMGLEKCPKCPFAIVIENDLERLLRCQRDDCGFVSCRKCKKEDHLPRTCQEVEADSKIDSIHKIEEAMSAALIRQCPKCSEPFIKEDGCNKMRCTSCHTLSCHVCRKIINGYEHFAHAGAPARANDPNAKCALWDDSVKRNYQEVEAARTQAAQEVSQADPNVTDADLAKLNLPPPPPQLPKYAPYDAAYARPLPMDAAEIARQAELDRQARERMLHMQELHRVQEEERRARDEERLRLVDERHARATRAVVAQRLADYDRRNARRQRALGR
ncbi:hypothetical protein OIO90_001999 [Microbotryomycetes sp. JL221]|nr:hypothetical protein OIO90_001999 [Microbotryomycetes sp. JL221]